MEKDSYLSFRYDSVFWFPGIPGPACIGREILYVGAILGTLSSQAIHDMASLMKD